MEGKLMKNWRQIALQKDDFPSYYVISLIIIRKLISNDTNIKIQII